MNKFLLALLFLCPVISLRAQINTSDVHHLADSLYRQHVLALDSILTSPANAYTELKAKYDSLFQDYNSTAIRFQNRIDSLNTLNLPTDHITQKLDSVNKTWQRKTLAIKDEFESFKESAKEKIAQLRLPPELRSKAEAYTAALDKVSLTMLSSSAYIPALKVGEFDLGVPVLRSPMPDGLADASTLVSPNVNGFATDALKVDGINQVVSKDITNIDQLTKVAENQVTQISEVAAIQEQLGSLPVSPISSQQEAKEQLLSMTKEAAVNHFAGKEQELKTVIDKISTYKLKYSNVNSLRELPKKRPNEMKGKPFIERIVPGIGIQLQRKDNNLLTDFNIYFGYRFTGRFTGGAGWNQRLGYNTNQYKWSSNQTSIYGPRMFSEYRLSMGFSPRLEVEAMNTFIPPFARITTVDRGERQWVWGIFVGMKKDYRIFKNIRGTALVMLRLFDPNDKSPYADVLNTRFGFELPMKKKGKTSKAK